MARPPRDQRFLLWMAGLGFATMASRPDSPLQLPGDLPRQRPRPELRAERADPLREARDDEGFSGLIAVDAGAAALGPTQRHDAHLDEPGDLQAARGRE